MSANNSPDRSEKEEPKAFSSRCLTDDNVSAESVVEIDGFKVLGLSSEDIEFYTGFSAQRRKRVVRKVDIRLVPVLTILYLIAHIDRANIGNAKIEGLIEDLGLTGAEYNISLAIFFVPYIFLLVDSPSLSRRWLDQEEIRFLELQVFIKQGGKSQEVQEQEARTWVEVKNVLKNWRVYVHGSFLIVNSACSYGVKFTLPTITKTMGYSNMNAQFLSAPPYVAGALSALVCGKLSDRFNWRMPFIAIPSAFILVGYSIMLSLNGAISTNASSVWPAIVIAVVGIYPIQPATQAWNANNIAPSSRRAVAVALTSSVGSVGGIVGSFMYLESQAPRYETGFGLSLAFGAYAMLIALALEWSYMISNARKAKLVSSTPHDDANLVALGDKNPLFKHVL
ncbi:hypothetical protein INS49_006374 [Diaporthe citri]|uniref:uncharacterized protein n=1 Tax=Diaporthe citri TaxID=83186 RepID=UPI001C7F4058|nr:uncharacterized protein INS49_006374 [Diaporthe citri]KAG6364770.1 hypothetical protein INS49_006374 [Diaporthe citri]